MWSLKAKTGTFFGISILKTLEISLKWLLMDHVSQHELLVANLQDWVEVTFPSAGSYVMTADYVYRMNECYSAYTFTGNITFNNKN
jgi:hypothetical protein